MFEGQSKMENLDKSTFAAKPAAAPAVTAVKG
jgi:hypothetical protein